jgi:hypothetical protein
MTISVSAPIVARMFRKLMENPSIDDKRAYRSMLAMTFIKRAFSILLACLMAVSLAACEPLDGEIHVTDRETGCPAGYRHIDIEGTILDHAGEAIDGRPYQLVVAAESPDPEYQGIYLVGVGINGNNPVLRDEVSDADDSDVDPVLCLPADRAVAVMVRVAMQHPAEAYEVVECELIDRGIVGVDELLDEGSSNGRVAYDQRAVDLIDLTYKDLWYIAQCDYVYIPSNYTGTPPSRFPQPEDV